MPAGNHVIYAETILSSSYLWRLHWLTIVSETCPSIKKKSHFSKREEKKGWWDRSVISCSLIPCGLVARIRRSHRHGRGSIPRTGVCLAMLKENKKHSCFFYCCLANPFLKHWRFITNISSLHTGQKPCQTSFYHMSNNLDLPST